MVQIGEVKAFGVGSWKVEAVQQLGGRLPDQRLLVDCLAGEEGPSGLVELGEKFRGEQVGESVAGGSEGDGLGR
ncbi:hypothetical protein [Streptomyces sp. ISL-86]|uniref:hypothetical protein n=1 Tax=Streptomyces sp. ISL-86 TaxID=2819187 RepID=UPI001BE94DD2|nr:hypothetical protein [Streptomyces sp. ISL-86]MBT2457278.1 hypothetical protein [Streptomyces sp. ISL-86]